MRWYSDGLIERRGQSLDVGLDRLAELAGALAGVDAQVWSDALLAAMTAGQPVEDDAVVACLHLDGPAPAGTGSAALRRTLRATSELAGTRAALRRWATGQHMSAAQTETLVLVCTEALTNALEHAYPEHSPIGVELTVVRADQGHVRVEVSDHGRWRATANTEEEQGRGLAMISRLSQRATLDLRENGTRITANLPTI